MSKLQSKITLLTCIFLYSWEVDCLCKRVSSTLYKPNFDMMEQHLLFSEALLFLGQLSEDQKHSPRRQKSEGSPNFVKMLPALLLQEVFFAQGLLK